MAPTIPGSVTVTDASDHRGEPVRASRVYVVTSAVIRRGREVLLVEEAVDTGTVGWSLPGGVVEPAGGGVAGARGRRSVNPERMDVEFSGEIWYWRGPAPWYFVTVPDGESAHLRAVSSAVSYGWGMIPVTARIGDTAWRTSLFPKDGRYVVPVKAVVRRAEGLDEGDVVTVRLTTGG